MHLSRALRVCPRYGPLRHARSGVFRSPLVLRVARVDRSIDIAVDIAAINLTSKDRMAQAVLAILFWCSAEGARRGRYHRVTVVGYVVAALERLLA